MLYQVRRKVSTIIRFSIVALLCSSCLFEKEEENFLHVESQPDPQYTPNLMYSYEGGQYYQASDTLWLSPSERVYLRFFGQRVYGYEIRINDALIVSSEENNSFELTPGSRKPGAYTLTSKVFVKSGTESLADKLEMEYAEYSSDVVLMITEDVSFVPEIISVEQKDGTVELKWKPYSRGDFHEYEIRKYTSENLYYGAVRVFKVSDRNQTTLMDSSYVGGNVYYAVLINRGGSYIRSQNYRTGFPYNPRMNLSILSTGRLRLSWEAPSFHKNILSVKITVHSSPTPLLFANWTNQGYVDFDSDVVFGSRKGYTISFTGKGEDSGTLPGDIGFVSESLMPGKRLPAFDDIEYNDTENAYYLIHKNIYYEQFPYPDGIYKLDQNLNIVDSTRHNQSGHLVGSPDGHYLYLFDEYRIRRIEKNPLRFSTVYGPASGGLVRNYQDVFAVSNNNFVYYHDSYDNDNILDFATQEVLFSVRSEGISHLSPNGHYFVDNKKIYEYDGTTFFHSATLPYDNIYFLRFLNDGQRLLIGTDTEVVIYNYATSSQETVYAFSTPPYSVRYFEHSSMKYTVHSSGIKRLNIETGEVDVVTNPLTTPYAAEFLAEYLFSAAGFAIKP